jgi:hypothetical protein
MMLVFMVIVNAVSSASSADPYRRKVESLSDSMAIADLNCMSVPLCLIGLGLAIVGLTVHPYRRHFLTGIGFFVNFLVLVGVLVAYFVGGVLRDQHRY